MKYLVLLAVLLLAGIVSAKPTTLSVVIHNSTQFDTVVELNVDGQDIPIQYVSPGGTNSVALLVPGTYDIRINGLSGNHNIFLNWSGGIILDYNGQNQLIDFAPPKPDAPPSHDDHTCSTTPSSAPLALVLLTLVMLTRLAWRRA